MDAVVPLLIDWYHQNIQEHGIVPSLDERKALAARVKAGDPVARESLILCFLRYSDRIAWSLTRKRSWSNFRIEYEDLAQYGMLRVLECLDQAVQKYADPFPYIFLSVRLELHETCRFRSNIIRTPETLDASGGNVHVPHYVGTIDVMANEEETVAETIPDLQHEILPPPDYTDLYAAVEALTGRYKEVILRIYGLREYAPESLPKVSRAISNGKSETMAGSYRALALKKLRIYMTGAVLKECK